MAFLVSCVRRQNSNRVLGPFLGSEICENNFSSLQTSILRDSAFANLLPAFSPATNTLRFPLTLPTILPPAFLIASAISFLGRDSDPVMQNDLPSKTPLADSASSVMAIISESSLIKPRRLEMPSLNIVATFSPIPSIVVSSSISPSSTQSSNFSTDVKY